jgi:copper chaperone CopZ
MHILTGFIVSSLLGGRFLGRKRRGTGRSKRPVLSFRGIIETVHLLPGRVRYRIPLLLHNPEVQAEIESRIPSIEGITGVEASTVSGSVLVRFDPQRIDYAVILTALAKVLGLEEELSKTPRGRIGEELENLSSGLNRAIYEYSRGLLDLKTVVPLSLSGLGLYSVLRRGSIALPGAFTLLWWAVNALQRGGGKGK